MGLSESHKLDFNSLRLCQGCRIFQYSNSATISKTKQYSIPNSTVVVMRITEVGELRKKNLLPTWLHQKITAIDR